MTPPFVIFSSPSTEDRYGLFKSTVPCLTVLNGQCFGQCVSYHKWRVPTFSFDRVSTQDHGFWLAPVRRKGYKLQVETLVTKRYFEKRQTDICCGAQTDAFKPVSWKLAALLEGMIYSSILQLGVEIRALSVHHAVDGNEYTLVWMFLFEMNFQRELSPRQRRRIRSRVFTLFGKLFFLCRWHDRYWW